MAKVLYGPIVSDARKKIGGVVATKSRFGSVIRKKSSPVQPRTNSQRAVRANFGANAKAWSGTLTSAQRQSWINLAAANPKKDRFGNTQTLTGAQMYNSLSRNLHTLGLLPLPTPPLNLSVDDPGGITLAELAAVAIAAVSAIVDASGGSNTVSSVAASANGVAVYTGVFTDGASNADAGLWFTLAGFSNAQNNGTFLCVASSGTTLTLVNPQAVAETPGAPTIASASFTLTVTGASYTASALIGQNVTTSGFSKPGNNGSFTVTANATGTLTLLMIGGAAVDTGHVTLNKSLTIKTTNAAQNTDWLVVTCTQPKNAGRTSLGKAFRVITAVPGVAAQPIGITVAYTGKVGAPITGQTINVGGYFINSTTGAAGKPYTATLTWA